MDLNDADKIRTLVVDPMVTALKAEITPLVARVATLEAQVAEFGPRVVKLEGYAGKLLKVYSGLIAVGTFAAHAAWQKVKMKFNLQ